MPKTATLLLALVLACDGQIGVVDGPPQRDTPPLEDGEQARPRWEHHTDAPELRLLSPDELVATLEDTLGQEVSSDTLPTPQVVEHHGHIAAAQRVSAPQTEAYVTLADEVAARIVAATACSDVGCHRSWAAERLPLVLRGDAEPEDYLSILDDSSAGESMVARAHTMWSVVLTSPAFLYRIERSAPDGVHLQTSSIASRLSYLIWQSAPDQTLLELARTDALLDPEVRAEQVERMLEDARARRGLRAFVRDWFGVVGTTLDTKDSSVLEGTDGTLPAMARQSLDATIDATLFGDEGLQGSLLSLLSTDSFVVDAQLAAILDLPPVDEGLAPRTLDTSRHLGLLMHPAVLAAHTKESGKSPFPIGKFIFESMLCDRIPPPPANAGTDIPPAAAGETLRESLEAATTTTAVCNGCHARIGPPGFAFLPYDPIGRFAEEDGAGRPWDTAGEVRVAGRPMRFADATDLALQLSEHEESARCVARRLFRWTYGRFESADDDAALDVLEDVSIASHADARTLLLAIVRSPTFAQPQPESAEAGR